VPGAVSEKRQEVVVLQRRVVEAEQRLASVPRLIEEGWEEELRNAYDTYELERLALEY